VRRRRRLKPHQRAALLNLAVIVAASLVAVGLSYLVALAIGGFYSVPPR
jgi:hypothetical protein